MKSYDMKQIIYNVNSWKVQQYDEKTKYNRLKKILKFIKESNMTNKNNKFISEVINLKDQDLENKFKGYKFNIETYIFLVCLCENDEALFFKKLINSKVWMEDEAGYWLDSIEKKLLNFEQFYKKETNKNNWENIFSHIKGIFYYFTIYDFNNEHAKFINEKICDVFARIIALPNDEKINLYNNGLKNRLNNIDTKLKNIIENMEIYNKNLYHIDLEIIMRKLK